MPRHHSRAALCCGFIRQLVSKPATANSRSVPLNADGVRTLLPAHGSESYAYQQYVPPVLEPVDTGLAAEAKAEVAEQVRLATKAVAAAEETRLAAEAEAVAEAQAEAEAEADAVEEARLVTAVKTEFEAAAADEVRLAAEAAAEPAVNYSPTGVRDSAAEQFEKVLSPTVPPPPPTPPRRKKSRQPLRDGNNGSLSNHEVRLAAEAAAEPAGNHSPAEVRGSAAEQSVKVPSPKVPLPLPTPPRRKKSRQPLRDAEGRRSNLTNITEETKSFAREGPLDVRTSEDAAAAEPAAEPPPPPARRRRSQTPKKVEPTATEPQAEEVPHGLYV